MALSASSYGTVAGVAAYVAHLLPTSKTTFDATTRPTITQVEAFLDQQSAKLNAWLAMSGYSTPVTAVGAVTVLSNFANLGAAGLCELTQRAAGVEAEGTNQRENKFLAEFKEAEAFITTGALAALGAGRVNAGPGVAGLSVGGRTRGGGRLVPMFTRTSFGQNPTAETGSLEPDGERT
jgi:hypothetical protein